MAELTDEQLLKIAADNMDGCRCKEYWEAYDDELIASMRAAIAADRQQRPQPTPEALQAAYAAWFQANQCIPPSPTAARTAAAFALAVLRGEVEL